MSIFGGGGDTETTVRTEMNPLQTQILQSIWPTLQRFTTPAGRPQQTPAQIQQQIAALQQGLMTTGGASGSSSERSSVNAQIAALNQQLANAQAGVQQPTAPGIYEGNRVAGFTPLEQAGRRRVAAAARGPMQDVANQAAGASQFLTSGDVLDPRRNPGLAGAIEAGIDPIRQEFLSSILPSIRGDSILSGAFGGSEQGELQNLAGESFMRQSGNVASNIINPAYQAGLDAFTRGLALTPQTAGLQLAPGQAIAGVGEQGRQMEQAQINADMQRWVEENYGDLLLAQQVAQIAFGIPAAGSTTTAQGGGMNPVMGGLGGAATGAGIGSLIAPGSGTAIGAGLGGLFGLFGSL